MIAFTCEKVLLQNAAAVASRAVSPKSSIPALEGLLIQAGEEGVTVSGYNMSTGIRSVLDAAVSDYGSVVVHARLFGDILRRMLDDIVAVQVDESLLVHLQCGDSHFDIAGIDAKDFPDLPVVEEEFSVSLRQDLFRDMIEQCAFCVSTNESRPVHTGALFEIAGEELVMVAVDGFRLAIRREKLDRPAGTFSFVAPGAALNEVKGICGPTEDPAVVTLGKQHILFEVGTTELICRRLEGEFLDYRSAVPRNQPIRLTAGKRELIDSIERVSVVISEKAKGPVRCLFEDNRVLLSAKTVNGEAKDVCRLEGDGEDLEIGFNNRYLLDALRYAPADTVELQLHNGVSPVVIVPQEGERFLYMVLPVRLRTE